MNVLMIIEVSQKQAYIFSSRKLKDNRNRSGRIAYVTSTKFFSSVCNDASIYKENNLVYSGGGHTVLRFDSAEAANTFAKIVSRAVLEQYPDMEYFLTSIEYDEALTPGDNLLRLSQKLESKKALRRSSFRLLSSGMAQSTEEPEQEINYFDEKEKEYIVTVHKRGFELSFTPEKWDIDDNFIAVVHIDGNAMGKRVQNIYETCGHDWDSCSKQLRSFSESIEKDYEAAFMGMTEELIRELKKDGPTHNYLPLRRIIRAGDDICFIVAGKYGLFCAHSFLKQLESKTNAADNKGYSACAGIVMVHSKYPFRQAYDLSEELCSNAKKFAAAYSPDGKASAMDWHIEFGQLKPSLSMIREDYTTEDGTRMLNRPIVTGLCESLVPAERTYTYLRNKLWELEPGYGTIARSKLKGFRTAIGQGELETEFYIENERLTKAPAVAGDVYADIGDERCCTCYDAIELMDHVILPKEE